MPISDAMIAQVTGLVFEAMLGWQVQVNGARASSRTARTVAASVQISGAWDGAVAVKSTQALAAAAAATMLRKAAGELSEEEIQDALGELANVIGGNLKAAVAGPCVLSVPTVVDGTVFTIRVRGTRPVRSVKFACDGGGFEVTVYEHHLAAASGAAARHG